MQGKVMRTSYFLQTNSVREGEEGPEDTHVSSWSDDHCQVLDRDFGKDQPLDINYGKVPPVGRDSGVDPSLDRDSRKDLLLVHDSWKDPLLDLNCNKVGSNLM